MSSSDLMQRDCRSKMAPSAGERRPKAPPPFHQSDNHRCNRSPWEASTTIAAVSTRRTNLSPYHTLIVEAPTPCRRPTLRQHRPEEEPGSRHRLHQDCPARRPPWPPATYRSRKRRRRRHDATHRTTGQVTAAPLWCHTGGQATPPWHRLARQGMRGAAASRRPASRSPSEVRR
jgi:hypothetical protein